MAEFGSRLICRIDSLKFEILSECVEAVTIWHLSNGLLLSTSIRVLGWV